MERVYRYRDELVFFDTINDSSLFYAPTLGICILCTPQLANQMQKYLYDGVAFSEFEEMLRCAWESRNEVYDLGSVKSRFFHIAIGLTENCTLACKYCHADAGKPTQISDELVQAAADYAKNKVVAEKLRGINLSFAVGGEPTFHFNRLKDTIQRFRKSAEEGNTSLKISMTTNGYYSEEIAEYVASNIDNILISVDGVKEVHNIQRPARNGDESFDKVLHTMDIVYSKKGELNIRSTISTINIGRMNEFVDFLAQRYEKNVTWVIEPMVPLGRGAHCGDQGVSAPDNMLFAEKYWETYLYGKSKGIEIKTSALNASRLVSGFCGAMYIPSFTLTTSGVVTTCERDSTGENYGYGYYDASQCKFVIDDSKVKKNQSLIIMQDKCLSCICRYHCAGDCPDVRTIGYDRCETNRYLLKKYLMSIIDEKGGDCFETELELGESDTKVC